MRENKFKYLSGNERGVFDLKDVTFSDFKSEFY